MSDYEKKAIAELATKIKAAGYRPFIAERGTYGFYTDNAGARVVSFGIDLGRIRFSGNYKTSSPTQTGTGWQIADNSVDFFGMFNSGAPKWATGNATWKYTTLDQHLKTYGPSSKYVEVVDESH